MGNEHQTISKPILQNPHGKSISQLSPLMDIRQKIQDSQSATALWSESVPYHSVSMLHLHLHYIRLVWLYWKTYSRFHQSNSFRIRHLHSHQSTASRLLDSCHHHSNTTIHGCHSSTGLHMP